MCTEAHGLLLYALVSPQSKLTVVFVGFLLQIYLQFFSDALALRHELRDYLGLLPQVLQLLGEKKTNYKISIKNLDTIAKQTR